MSNVAKPSNTHKNEVHLAGELAKDPEVKYTPTGKCVAHLTVVTRFEKFSEYHRVTAWEKLAEKAAELAKKGDFVKVVGRLQTRSWEDPKTKTKRFSTEIVAWQLSLDREPLTPTYDAEKPARGGTEAAKAILKPPQPKSGTTVNAHGLAVSDEDVPF